MKKKRDDALLTVAQVLPELRRLVDARPWLVMGKGPSFARLQELERHDYAGRVALNHVAAATDCDIACMNDLEVVGALGERLLDPGIVVLPDPPRVGCRDGNALSSYLQDYPALYDLAKLGGVATFRRVARPQDGDVCARISVAEVAFSLLSVMGVREIHIIGIDGGVGYARGFDMSDHLRSGHASFDAQWPALREIVQHRNLTVREALTGETPCWLC